jgi:hypothetical protein
MGNLPWAIVACFIITESPLSWLRGVDRGRSVDVVLDSLAAQQKAKSWSRAPDYHPSLLKEVRWPFPCLNFVICQLGMIV